MPLTPEMRHDLNWWLWPRLFIVIGLVIVVFGGMFLTLLRLSENLEKDMIRSELSDIDHRIVHEECVVRPVGQIVRQRIHDRREDARIDICDPDKVLPDLKARRELLDARLREKGAYEERRG